MTKYLGEFDVDVKDTPYANYTPSDWVTEYVFRYSHIDGSHHKQWALDQTVRILKGTKVNVKIAKWDDGQQEYQFYTGEPSQEYLDWVKEYREIKPDYDEGIAP